MIKVSVIGCGVVGSSWSLVFARAGLRVSVFDPSRSSVDRAMERVMKSAAELESLGLLRGRTAEQIFALLTPTASLEEALQEADYIQESAPERIETKRDLYKKLGSIAKKDAVLASSTSGFPASMFSQDVEGHERVIVAHPIHPPHLVPLVEIVPSPWTSRSVVERTEGLMKMVGQVPIVLRREINGFIVNRLQSAVLSEAFRLVEDGVCSVKDVDAAMADGLGLRWCLLGPFETIDLNAENGIVDYCAKLGPMFYELATEQANPRRWSIDLVANVEKQRREITPADGLEARKSWRDRCLAALLKAKLDIVQKHVEPNSPKSRT
jgi:3-hydroxyacyl-CoA dehydrogenase